MKRTLTLCLAILLLASAGLSGSTFTVTTTADSGAGSLRQAILDANANAGLDTIAFNIPGAGVHTIAPLSGLPTITDPVAIDGYTQPGSSANTLPDGDDAMLLIVLAGPADNLYGLDITAGNSSVKGLVINNWNFYAVHVTANGGNTIAGNFLGTDASGTVGIDNGQASIFVGSGVNTIGGTTPAARNIISGSSPKLTIEGVGANGNLVQGNFIGTNAAGTSSLGNGPGINLLGSNNVIGGTTAGARNLISTGAISPYGIVMAGATASGNVIQGNYIGTDATGAVALGSGVGIYVNGGVGNVIGGASPGAGNVISGNIEGIDAGGPATGTLIQGNLIGTNAAGTGPLGNSFGIRVFFGSGLIIGGGSPGAGNIIAYNGIGVAIATTSSSPGYTISRNSIFSNAALGIELYDGIQTGPTPNDLLDPDTGPNDYQNFPVISSAAPLAPAAPEGGTGTRVQGVLHSTASTLFTLEFFSNPACIPFPHDFLEGQTFLGSTQVTTDGSGTAAFDVMVPVAIGPGEHVTATATDPGGSTSEFSQRLPFSISPASGPPAVGSVIVIAGTDFQTGATVTVGGTAATGVTVNSFNKITATTPALAAGTVNDVTVTNTDSSVGTLEKGWVSDFLDVPPSQQFYSFVTTLVSNGITVGVGGGLYGVNASTLRQQMAVFLLKGKYGICYAPPPCTPGFFADVPCPSTFANWIEALANEGITGGCGGGNYCPTNPVRRDQMAVFLLKAEHGSAYVPPVCVPPGVFPDVPCPGTFTDWIEQLAAEAITGGCGGGNYCPLNPNTRGQMAVFITKTFNLQ